MKKIIIFLLLMVAITNLSYGQASMRSTNSRIPAGKKNNLACDPAQKRNNFLKSHPVKQNPAPSLQMAPPNNNSCNAILVTVNGPVVTGTNVAANTQNNEVIPPDGSSCTANDGWCENPAQIDNTVWYQFVVPPGGIVQISTCNGAGSFDTQLAVWKATVCNDFTTFTFIGANDDGVGCLTTYTSLLQLTGLTPGDTLLIQLDGFLGDVGTFDLEVTTIVTPINDQPCNATPVTIGGSAGTFSNLNALVDLNESSITPPAGPCVGTTGWCEFVPTIDHSVWFTFVAPPSGAVSISTCNSANPFDTQLALYEVGTCNDYTTYTLLAANDDGDTSLCSTSNDFFTSYLITCGLTPGNTYFLLVDGYFGATGDFDLEINTATTTPPVLTSGATYPPTCSNGSNGVAMTTVNGGIEPYSYQWSNGYPGSALIAASGTYTVTVTDHCGLSSTQTATIPPTTNNLIATTGNTLHICDGTPLTLSTAVNGGVPKDTAISFFAMDLINSALIRFGLSNLGTPLTIIPGVTDLYYAGDLTPNGFYAIDDNTNELVALDLVNGIKSSLGKLDPKPGHNWTGMAWDPAGNSLYGLSSDATSSTLYTINPLTSTATFVSDLASIPIGICLACSPGGTLFAVDIISDSLFRIDKTNGQVNGIGAIGFDANFAQGADFDDVSGSLYFAAYNNTLGAAALYTLDTTTGASTFIGNLVNELDAFACFPYTNEGPFTYNWTPAAGLSATDIANPQANPAASTTYTVTITDGCGLTATATQEVTVSNVTATTNSINVSFFGGTDGSSVVLPAGGTAPYSYLWSNGITTDSISNLVAGTYTVTVTDANGCTSTGVSVISQPNAIEDPGQAGFSGLSVSPNPTKGKIVLSATMKEKMGVEIQLFSISGKQLLRFIEPSGIILNKEINMVNYQSGVYFIRLKTSKGIYNQRVILE